MCGFEQINLLFVHSCVKKKKKQVTLKVLPEGSGTFFPLFLKNISPSLQKTVMHLGTETKCWLISVL